MSESPGPSPPAPTVLLLGPTKVCTPMGALGIPGRGRGAPTPSAWPQGLDLAPLVTPTRQPAATLGPTRHSCTLCSTEILGVDRNFSCSFKLLPGE